MLRRLGNKTRLLPKLLDLFPKDITTFIDMFMGSGAVTFAMVDRAKYIIANDKGNDIFNLFLVLKEQRDALVDAIQLMPIHQSLLIYWKTHEEADPVWRAVRFLMRSNFGHMGKPETLKLSQGDDKQCLTESLLTVFERIQHVKFMCCDFRDALSKIGFRHGDHEREQAFIYADPPYLGTTNNYQDSFTEQDTQDLFEILVKSGIRFALSEFAHPVVMELARQYGLSVTSLGERQTLKNRQTELLITNYDVKPLQTNLF